MTRPMEGVKVVELASWTFVPAAGAVLADWGADVIKVEHPRAGDPQRALVLSGLDDVGINYMMEIANRGKRSVGIDLASPGGIEVLRRLVKQADVFLTNFLPDARERLGIDGESLRAVNPRLVYVVGSGYGPLGPDARQPGYDGTAFWARASVAKQFTVGARDWPVEATPAVGDLPGGATIAGAICAALFHRERTGEGAVVDVSLLAVGMWMMAPGIVQAGIYGPDVERVRDRYQNRNPISILYATKDGRHLKLSMLESDRWWAVLCRHIDRVDLIDDPRFADAKARATNSAECVRELDAAFGSRTLAEWRERFARMEAPWGAVQTPAEVLDDPQVLANGYVTNIETVDGRACPVVPAPAQFDLEVTELRPCPGHGEHTDEVLAELGYDWDTVVELKVAGAVL